MNTSQTTTPAPRKSVMRAIKKWTAILFVLVIALGVLYIWAALNFSFSDGERTGYILKFSRKGWVCKTWEGEMQLIAMPGAMPERFAFTVRDETVAKAINRVMGRQVSLEYAQHVGLPTTCFGETSYFVRGVRLVDAPLPGTELAPPPAVESAPAPEPGEAPAPVPAPAQSGAAVSL
ncbi:MAG: hypothetical protein FWD62_06370 [Betaproteobacteria bacterium]|nr:hypothetical protein [Betaproteobacteria bacterium]